MSTSVETLPKNIVLFSDGTGNSASKQFKTNVWRTYRALDLDDPADGERRQIAFYRDGVGAETFKPLAMLGGAFGFGVMRDVRALYTFLCRNYRDGDGIYAFGFSRGAFTLRLLIELISECGLPQVGDEAERKRCVTYAYKAFRRRFIIKRSKTKRMIYRRLLPPPYYHKNGKIRLPCPAVHPSITFLGLWDTVEAYGMPVEELKTAIDAWIWPMTLADRTLSSIVLRAFHALSLDDERPTFSPVLWNEEGETTDRIQQMWFAGVHANVGGGYPIDSLAHVPLCWMLTGAQDAHLRFKKGAVEKFESVADPHGVAYDSRSGVAGYYRYGPRDLAALRDDKINGVKLNEPLKIHPSVVQRIAGRQVRYAPVSLPTNCVLRHPDDGREFCQRSVDRDQAKAVIWWRKIVYYSIVCLSLFLLLAPVIDALDIFHDWSSPIVTKLMSLLKFLPAWSHQWLDAFSHHPIPAFALITLLAWLFFRKSDQLQQWVANRSEWAWGDLKTMPASPSASDSLGDTIAKWAQKSYALNKIADLYNQHFSSCLGFLLFLAILAADIAIVTFCVILIFKHYYIAMTLSFASACYWFFKANGLRHDVAAAVCKKLELDPSRCLPELKWSYDQVYIERFKSAGLSHTFPNGISALETYHTQILVFRDIFFAISLAVFIGSTGCLIGQLTGHLILSIYFFVTGTAYGLADVFEDLVLSRLFAERTASKAWSRTANLLTQLKMFFICISLIGLFAFSFLLAVAYLRNKRKPPGMRTASSDLDNLHKK